MISTLCSTVFLAKLSEKYSGCTLASIRECGISAGFHIRTHSLYGEGILELAHGAIARIEQLNRSVDGLFIPSCLSKGIVERCKAGSCKGLKDLDTYWIFTQAQ